MNRRDENPEIPNAPGSTPILRSILAISELKKLKQVKVPRSRRIGPVHVWKEALQECYQLAQRCFGDTQVRVGSTEYASLDEFFATETRASVQKLSMKSWNDTLFELDFEPKYVSIYIGGSDVAYIGALTRILEILEPAQLKRSILISGWLPYVLSIVLLPPTFINSGRSAIVDFPWLFGFISILFLLWPAIANLDRFQPVTKLSMQPYVESPSFVARHGEKIAYLLAGALISLLLQVTKDELIKRQAPTVTNRSYSRRDFGVGQSMSEASVTDRWWELGLH